jgi:fibronectin-binding autotransporter adhesin
MSLNGVRSKRKNRRDGAMKVLACAAAGVILPWRFAAADTTANWQFPVNGNWTDDTTWSTAPNYPNNGTPMGVNYRANISVAGTYAVSLANDITIDGLTLNSANATLSQTAGNLNLNMGAFNLTTGTYQLSGGTLSNGTLSLGGGRLMMQSGTLDNLHITGGDLNLDQVSGSNTTIQNGLTIDSHTINASGYSAVVHIFDNSLSGNNLNITNYAYVYFDGQSPSLDNSTINIPAQYNGQIYVGGPGSGGSTTFTMGTHATLNGAITLADYYGGSTLINNGNINANVSGQTLTIQTSNFTNQGLAQATNGGTLTISSNWSNTGTLAASNASTINLGGSFTTAAIGTTNISADSTVNITGAMDNTTSTFTPGAGSWFLNGGSITNGTMNLSAGNFHVGTGTLDNVHITGGDLNLDQTSGSTTIQNGLAIDTHNINMSANFVLAHIFGNSLSGNNLNITNYAYVYFDGQNPSVDNSTIDIPGQYNGQIYVGGASSGGSTTFTMGTHATLSGATTVADYFGGSTLINNGNINANVAGQTLSIQISNFTNHGLAQATNGGTLTINSANWSNTGAGGTLKASNASTINLGGSFTTAAIGTTSISADSMVNIAGAMDNTTSTFTPTGGSWFLKGGTITNGTMNLAAGNFHVGSGTLDNVHVTGGDLNVDQYDPTLMVQNGLTIDSHNINVSGLYSNLYFLDNSLSGNNVNASADGLNIFFDGPSQSIDNSTINIAMGFDSRVYVDGPNSVGGSTTFTMGTHATLSGVVTVYSNSSGDNLINNGSINANVSGKTLNLSPTSFTNHGLAEATNGGILAINSPSWSSTGMLAASDASTINLGGAFTTASVNTTNISADSTVNITGAMDNTTSTFTPVGGSWFLKGGTITNGTMNLAAGNFHVGSGTLDGVHVTGGDLNLDQLNSMTTIYDGLTVDSPHTINLSGFDSFLDAFDNSLSGNNLNVSNLWIINFDDVNPSLDNSTINIPAQYSGTIYVGGPSSGGSTTFTMGTHATLSGAVTVIDYYSGSTLLNKGTINASVAGQTLNINTSKFTNQGKLKATNGGILEIGPGTTFVSSGSIDTSGGILDNETTAQINGPATFGSIIGNGSLLIGPGVSADIAAGSAPSEQAALTLGAGSLLNIRNNSLTLNYSGSPNAAIRNYISSAYNVNGTLWSGTTGITSSNAAANPGHRSIAFADGTDGVVINLPAGVSAAIPGGGQLPAGYELITSAFPGDGNLDGKVDFNDFVLISTHFLASDINWDHGNFNYDGVVDFNDFVVLSTNFGEGVTGGDGTGATAAELAQFNSMATSYGISKAQIAAWDATISTLPEPTSASLLMAAGFLLLRRRKAGVVIK